MRPLLASMVVLALAMPKAAAQDGTTTATVLDVIGTVLPLEEKILDLEGLAAGTRGEIVSLDAAASDLAARDSSLTVRRAKDGLRIAMKGDVLFAFDAADIQPEAAKTLAALAEVVRKAGNGPVIVEGHTDSKGTAKYNRNLSKRRAEAVIEWLAAKGFDQAIFVAKGQGADDPVAPNTRPDGRDNPDGRQQNRRVEFVFPKAGG